MTDGTSQGLFIVVAIVIFGIFVVLAYILFEDTLSPAMANMFTNATETASKKLYYESLTPEDEQHFTISDEGVLLSYTGSSKDIVIPRKVRGITVHTIGSYFHHARDTGKLKLESVVIPDTVHTIKDHAFRGNNIHTFVIPDSVTTIGVRALEMNYNLTKVTTPKNVTEIPTALYYGSGMRELTISQKVTIIGRSAFHGNNIEEVTIPESVTYIGDYAFMMNKFSEITIPKNVTYLGEGNFAQNENLEKIYIPKHLEQQVRENTEIMARTFTYNVGSDKYEGTTFWDIDEMVTFY